MTMLRLKDRELQKKLDELSNGEFSKALQNPHSEALLRMPPIETLNVNFGGTIGKGLLQARFTMRLLKDDVEVVPEYNPHGWNDFPSVTPPEGVWMRCERPNDLCVDGIERMCLKYMVDEQGGFWTDDCESGDLGYENMRFRPWED